MSRLEFLDRFNKEEPKKSDPTAVRDLAFRIGGGVVTTAEGSYLEVVTDYPLRFLHGVKALETILVSRSVPLDCFDIQGDAGELDLADAIFIDAETTGLSTAPGTVAFLVGVGSVVADGFRVHQFFLPDYQDEPALLTAIAELTTNRGAVVSFNGKAFDLPLLETRYALQRRTTPFVGMRHIDLLHVSRRFWKGRFVDNTLQTLEKELLSVYRYNDTPGYLIPQLYFDFLASGDAEPLEGVLLHNRLDIVTLLFLMKCIEDYLHQAERFDFYSPLDALVIARHFTRRGETEKGSEIAARQFHGKVDDEVERALGLHLFKLQKRLGYYQQALATLTHLRRSKGEVRLYAMEEAAKIMEHKLRDCAAATQVVLDAIEYLESPLAEIPDERILFWSETLKKRRHRLLSRGK
jgi:hypothetical protein